MRKLFLFSLFVLSFILAVSAFVAGEGTYNAGLYGETANGTNLYGVVADAGPIISQHSPNYTSDITPEISVIISDVWTGVQTNSSSPIIINISNGTISWVYNSSNNCSGNCSYNESAQTFIFIQPSNMTEKDSYLVTITAGDKGQPINTRSFSWNMTVDKTKPVIAFTLSDTSVFVNGDITGSCSATDNLDANPAEVITGISTSTTGTKTATCTATDDTGNSATSTVSYTVSSRPPTGGGESATAAVSQSITTDMAAGETTLLAFTNPSLPISDITFALNEAENNVKVTVTSLPSKPADVPAVTETQGVYKYIEIAHPALDNLKIKSAKIKFKAEKSYFKSSGFTQSDVALYRYAAGAWQSLSTSVTSEDDSYYYFEAISPGLSYFAIGIKEVSTPVVTPPVTETKTEPVVTPPETKPAETTATPTPPPQVPVKIAGISVWLLITIVVIVIIAAALLFIFKGREEELTTPKPEVYVDVQNMNSAKDVTVRTIAHATEHKEDKKIEKEMIKLEHEFHKEENEEQKIEKEIINLEKEFPKRHAKEHKEEKSWKIKKEIIKLKKEARTEHAKGHKEEDEEIEKKIKELEEKFQKEPKT